MARAGGFRAADAGSGGVAASLTALTAGDSADGGMPAGEPRRGPGRPCKPAPEEDDDDLF